MNVLIDRDSDECTCDEHRAKFAWVINGITLDQMNALLKHGHPTPELIKQVYPRAEFQRVRMDHGVYDA